MTFDESTWIDTESDDEWILTEAEDEPLELDFHEGLRATLSEDWRNASSEQIDAMLESVTRGMTIAEAESFWNSVAKIGRQVAPVAGQVLGVAAPLIGGAIGGPAGAAIGNVAGRYAGQALGSLGAPASRPFTPVAPSASAQGMQPAPAPIAPPPATAPPPSTALPGGSSATAQLLSFLQNPQLIRSILGQLMGSAGQSTQPVGASGSGAPFGAFMNALGVLANQAAAAAAEDDSSEYLYDSEGHLLADPSSPEERAAVLLAELRATPLG